MMFHPNKHTFADSSSKHEASVLRRSSSMLAADFPPFHPIDASPPFIANHTLEMNFTTDLLKLEEGDSLAFDSADNVASLISLDDDDHWLDLESTDNTDTSPTSTLDDNLLASSVQSNESKKTITMAPTSLAPLKVEPAPQLQHVFPRVHLPSSHSSHLSTHAPIYWPLSMQRAPYNTSPMEGQTPIAVPYSTELFSNVPRPASIVGAAGFVGSSSNGKQYVQVDRECDVLLGRGKRNQRNPGNIRYLEEVKRLASEYHDASPHSAPRTYLTQELVERVQQYGGRFLEHDGIDWHIIAPSKAHTKASQSLRESKLTREQRRAKAARFVISRRKRLTAAASSSGIISSDESQSSSP